MVALLTRTRWLSVSAAVWSPQLHDSPLSSGLATSKKATTEIFWPSPKAVSSSRLPPFSKFSGSSNFFIQVKGWGVASPAARESSGRIFLSRFKFGSKLVPQPSGGHNPIFGLQDALVFFFPSDGPAAMVRYTKMATKTTNRVRFVRMGAPPFRRHRLMTSMGYCVFPCIEL